MFDIKVGDMVMRGGQKVPVTHKTGFAGMTLFYTKGHFDFCGRGQLKPVIRLTPLVRAEMLIQAVGDLMTKSNLDGTPVVAVYPRGMRVTWPNFKEVTHAVRVIQSIGGYEAAQLYTDCDGYVNGRFIRGDDVRRALRILEGL